MIGLIPLTPMGAAIGALYGLASTLKGVNDFFDGHIDELKRSQNHLIAITGRVLEGAKFGFGLGYIGTITILAAGQLLLGNPLAAVTVAVTGVVAVNPVAMTCGAVGAVVYGWAALTDAERNALLDKLTAGLELGRELIRSIIDYVLRTTKALLTSKQLQEFKAFIASQAARFGKTLYDVTGQIADFVVGTVAKVGDATVQALDSTTGAVRTAARLSGQIASKTAGLTKDTARALGDSAEGTAVVVGEFANQALDTGAGAVRTAMAAASGAALKTAGSAKGAAKAVGNAANAGAGRVSEATTHAIRQLDIQRKKLRSPGASGATKQKKSH